MASVDSLADHLVDLDTECSHLSASLSRNLDEVSTSVFRFSENETGPVAIAFEFGGNLQVEPGGSVRREVVRVLESLLANAKGPTR